MVGDGYIPDYPMYPFFGWRIRDHLQSKPGILQIGEFIPG